MLIKTQDFKLLTCYVCCTQVPLKSIVAGIEAVEVVPGRSELIDEGQEFSVIVDAADTPEVRLRSAHSHCRQMTCALRLFLKSSV